MLLSLPRLRRLQAGLAGLGVDALVLILGLDSGFHAGTYRAFDHLFPGCRAQHPALDNVVLVVEPAAVHAILDSTSHAALAPALCGRLGALVW